MQILVINSGSSSIKSELIDSNTQELILKYSVEKVTNHNSALDLLLSKYKLDEIDAFAHRVVHGGDKFYKSVIIDDNIIKILDSIEYLAPLHNPHNIKAIKILKQSLPNIPQVAVFDTAFHHTLPPKAYMYALPYKLYLEEKIRKYGFHGSSHQYLSQKCAKILKKDINSLNIISLHLGNGCSACAIKNGKSIDTTMGFTPLQGLMMGTRSGDIDPSIILYLVERLHKKPQEINDILNKQSGLKGICQYSDIRDVLKANEDGDELAKLALEMFIYKIAKAIGAYFIVLGKVDAIIFSGGIGEHSALVRQKICDTIQISMGIDYDNEANEQNKFIISTNSSNINLLVIPTNEELHIALEAKSLLT
jgi:acetate kinase